MTTLHQATAVTRVQPSNASGSTNSSPSPLPTLKRAHPVPGHVARKALKSAASGPVKFDYWRPPAAHLQAVSRLGTLLDVLESVQPDWSPEALGLGGNIEPKGPWTEDFVAVDKAIKASTMASNLMGETDSCFKCWFPLGTPLHGTEEERAKSSKAWGSCIRPDKIRPTFAALWSNPDFMAEFFDNVLHQPEVCLAFDRNIDNYTAWLVKRDDTGGISIA